MGIGLRIGAAEIGIGQPMAGEAGIARSGRLMAGIGLLMAGEAGIGLSARVMATVRRVRPMVETETGRRVEIGPRIGGVESGIGLLMVVAGGIARRGLRMAGIGLRGRLTVAGETVLRVRRMVATGLRVGIAHFDRARRATVRGIGRFGLGSRSRADSSAISAWLA